MIDPTKASDVSAAYQARPLSGPDAAEKPAGDKFAAALREQLESVSKLQGEADEKVRQLLTGESQNVTDVFTATRKAQVAFTLMMELRNKLVDAYQELQNLRI